LTGCADRETPEQRISRMIDAAESAVESRSLGGFKAVISAQYRDEKQRTRRDLVRLAAGYFFRHESIHLLVQTSEIVLEGRDRARVLLYVAMAGQPLNDASQLAGLRADLYRFDLDLAREEGEWRVSKGHWRRARSDDFLE